VLAGEHDHDRALARRPPRPARRGLARPFR
jgi:hypothetical protein